MKMKKIFAIALVIAMVVALAACASGTKAGAEVLQNPLVRQALALAIDRDYINETVYNNSRVPAYALVPPGIPDAATGSDFRQVGGDAVAGTLSADYQANVKKAKELLAAAGFPDGKGFPNLELSYNTSTGHQAVCEAIQKSWKDNLGITVHLVSMEWNSFQDYRKTAAMEISRNGWIGDYTDPATFFDLLLSTAGNNDGHYSNAVYDKLVNSARGETDTTKRMELYHEAEDILLNDMGMIPIVYYANDVLSQTDYTGWAMTGTGIAMFWDANKAATICLASEPNTVDPNLNKSVDGADYVTQLYEGLYRQNTDGTFSLGQAASEPTWNGNVATVKLRDDIYWSDGKPVTANDFVFSWRRLMDPANPSDYAYLGEFLKNGAEVEAGTVTPDQLGVTAVDEKTLQFEIVQQIPYLKNLLAFPNFMPLRQDIVSASDKWAQDPSTMVFNGRYVISSWTHESELVMDPNTKYWDAAGNAKAQKLTFKLMSDDNAIYAAFKTKDIDLCVTFPADERATIMATPEYHKMPYIGLYYFSVNNLAVGTPSNTVVTPTPAPSASK
jgi:ABC-type oligopeptide transport system substrate-binding subunit